jgi:hypothetical protein
MALDENVSGTYDSVLPEALAAGTPPMPDIVADLPDPTCSHLLSKSGMKESQALGIDPSSPHARDARVRGFAKGSSGNPRGRPRGIRNPRRRVPDLIARSLSAQALSDLLDRKPHLLGPLAVQLLPPPLKPIDPANRLGIDLSSLRTAEDLRELLPKVLAAIARGEITPAEGARLARRARTRLRAIRRLARFERRLARQTRPALRGDRKVGPKLVSNSTDSNVSGESGCAANSAFHAGLAFSKAVRARYAAISGSSIIRITGPVSGPGTVLRNSRIDWGMTGLLKGGSAAACSLGTKSSKRPGLTSYLKIASTVIAPPSRACPDPILDKGRSQPERRAGDQNVIPLAESALTP